MRSVFVISTLAFIVPVFSAPTVTPVRKHAGPLEADSYIIKFKDGAAKESILDTLTQGLTQSGSSVMYNYDGSLLNGAALKLTGSDLALAQRLPNVDYIEQVSIVSLSYEEGIDGFPHITEVAERGIQPEIPNDNHGSNGAGVVIYGIDTGIYTGHSCFEGRARWGKTFVNYSDDIDGNGHGTHTAATAIGKGFGLATGAEMVAVKVMSDKGFGVTSDIIAGVEWSFNEYKKSNKPSIATMSVGGVFSNALNDAVKKAIAGNLHFAISAGNGNINANKTSPSSVEEANVIGAVDSNNQKADFSNWGPLLDVWAPGVNITSAWITGPNSTAVLSGTSMATPHVAGILAVVLGNSPNSSSVTPADLSAQLKKHAKQVVTFSSEDENTDVAKTSTRGLAQVWEWE